MDHAGLVRSQPQPQRDQCARHHQLEVISEPDERGRSDFPDEVVTYVARQTKTSPGSVGLARQALGRLRDRPSGAGVPPGVADSLSSVQATMTTDTFWREVSQSLTSILPTLPPRIMSRKAEGARSMPSATVTSVCKEPSASQPAAFAIHSGNRWK